ncbi:hypothetical protein BL250_13545 [Erwinia sp. OLTSP20]|uniref:DUF808 family protein n=1 Tax=unclassified Erwinia TaxID=2622719 RepID=UPI000C18D9A4|nr:MULTISPECIES: DUF808 family protein [unclassified Erwinia]PIJ48525.1 hypothetical protein BV501_16740 [Erwinia sp. OAMSP11]PIJ69155.1 hypothetical protein BK416_15490 [Erwinia sp. OLSSP12]PIJ78790.1 hypothetical protein BLD47_16690 [Erwinia sp. OLCASP19]PIJ81834.1 hypothetical protein BLD46_12175 [Erwinia sp. OLMTSP26]PIJ82112.1 hypothetical protein BLD49_15800 [Erwinia sp. OLMDSP33]
MAASSLLTLLDDIATLLDDISVMGKIAAKKTAGVLGDDLSLNAQQVSGVTANRELPVVWGVFKGSFINKVILVPLALVISAFAAWAITPLLMLGGAYLCYEGAEKVLHSLQHNKHGETPQARQQRLAQEAQQGAQAYEKRKVKGAVRTDFILSAEIVAITLGVVSEAPLLNQVVILSLIAVAVTVGVYGLVAAIVKLDDLGLWLQQRQRPLLDGIGRMLLVFAPLLMKLLSVVGTLAMFLVGGGIIVHGVPLVHHLTAGWSAGHNKLVAGLIANGSSLVIGLLLGLLVLLVVSLISRLRDKQ